MTMKEITKGKDWKIQMSQNPTATAYRVYDTSPENPIAIVYGLNLHYAKVRAELIAEAGTVKNETGFSPRQLADQKAELVELAINFKLVCHNIFKGRDIDIRYWERQCDKAIKSNK